MPGDVLFVKESDSREHDTAAVTKLTTTGVAPVHRLVEDIHLHKASGTDSLTEYCHEGVASQLAWLLECCRVVPVRVYVFIMCACARAPVRVRVPNSTVLYGVARGHVGLWKLTPRGDRVPLTPLQCPTKPLAIRGQLPLDSHFVLKCQRAYI